MAAERIRRSLVKWGRHPGAVISGAAVALLAALVVWVLSSRQALRAEGQRQLVGRDAAVLHPIVLRQLALHKAGAEDPFAPLRAALRSADQAGMLAMAVFDSDGALVQAVPPTLTFLDLPPGDYLQLAALAPITRYHAAFSLRARFGSALTTDQNPPVVEVLLPLYRPGDNQLAGVVQYWIDARNLARELDLANQRTDRQAWLTLLIGAGVIVSGAALSYWRLSRAQREIAERNERLIRANLELSLAAKASVLGQITSHLLHGLQAPVAGLRAVMASRGQGDAGEDWQTAADYTARLQQMIQQTVAMLGERDAHVSYELSAAEFVDLLHQRHRAAARARGITLSFTSDSAGATLASHRGNLLALVAGNLIENAIDASPRGATVHVSLAASADAWHLRVADSGRGIPPHVRSALFQPGRSTKPGGTGLGLAISHLLARQIGAALTLRNSTDIGTTFEIALPLREPAA